MTSIKIKYEKQQQQQPSGNAIMGWQKTTAKAIYVHELREKFSSFASMRMIRIAWIRIAKLYEIRSAEVGK